MSLFFNSIPVHVTELMVDDAPARTHRKKRLNKKYLKKYGMKQVPSNRVLVSHEPGYKMFIMHPKMWACVQKQGHLMAEEDLSCKIPVIWGQKPLVPGMSLMYGFKGPMQPPKLVKNETEFLNEFCVTNPLAVVKPTGV